MDMEFSITSTMMRLSTVHNHMALVSRSVYKDETSILVLGARQKCTGIFRCIYILICNPTLSLMWA